MSNTTDHAKNYGGLTPVLTAAGSSPTTKTIYKDVNGLTRIPNSGVVIAGQPEALSGLTLTTENDRGKTS